MNDFLPKDYKEPESNYFKLKEGKNTFRVMSPAITGYEYWNTDNKPVRSKEPFKNTADIRVDKDGKPNRVKHFWAFIVWNIDAEVIQIMEITQKTIQDDIKALVNNEEWGDPKKYNITITRNGEGLNTKYVVMPSPHSDISEQAHGTFTDIDINLDALYDGNNPFETEANFKPKMEKAMNTKVRKGIEVIEPTPELQADIDELY